jgi:hypothetical protein
MMNLPYASLPKQSALVSPQDVWTAASQLAELDIPFQARTLQSGARVVHSSHFSDESFFALLNKWCSPTKENESKGWTGISSSGLAQKMSISNGLAGQLLLHALQHAVVAFDAPSCSYYINLFKSVETLQPFTN